MTSAIETFTPSITGMIRLDHTHVLAVFHRFKPNAPAWRKQALVRNACLALEIHAQLEEEIFYPALRLALGRESVLDKSKPEHDEMRQLIAELRAMRPDDPAYDRTFCSLIRGVLHHVADEETVLLPQAERVLDGRLGELGARMTKRRMQLMAPHAGQLAVTTVGSFPAASFLFAAGVLALGALWVNRASSSESSFSLDSARDTARDAWRRLSNAIA